MEHIQTGQKITANWLNQIVDLAEGSQLPYSEGVFKTGNGPLMYKWNDWTTNTMTYPQLFQVKMAPAQNYMSPHETESDLSVIGSHMWINLGRSFPAFCQQFELGNNYVDRACFITTNLLHEAGEGRFFHVVPIDQNSFAVNEDSSEQKDCTTPVRMLIAESSTSCDYSGWVETPYTLEFFYDNVSTDEYSTLYCHYINFIEENSESTNKFTRYCAAVFSQLPVYQLNQIFTSEEYQEEKEKLEEYLGAKIYGICAQSTKIIQLSVKHKKLYKDSDVEAIQHINQLHTGPVIMQSQQPIFAEVAPVFSFSLDSENANQLNINVGLPLTKPTVEKIDDDYYVGVCEWTTTGLPIYVKVDGVSLTTLDQDGDIDTVNTYESKNKSEYGVYFIDGPLNDNACGLLILNRIQTQKIDEISNPPEVGSRRIFMADNNLFVSLWVKPYFSVASNKWTARISCQKGNGYLDNPGYSASSMADGKPTTQPWCLGWAKLDISKLNVQQYGIYIGDKHGTLTEPIVDTMLGRRTADEYVDEDISKMTYSSLEYGTTDLVMLSSIDGDLDNVHELDFRPLQLYKFQEKNYGEQPTLDSLVEEKIPEEGGSEPERPANKISLVTRVEHTEKSEDEHGESIEQTNVYVEYVPTDGLFGKPDADVSAAAHKSLNSYDLSGKTIWQLYNFKDQTAMPVDYKRVTNLASGDSLDIVVRDTNAHGGPEIQYATLTGIPNIDDLSGITPDTNAQTVHHRSIEIDPDGNLEVYNFHDPSVFSGNLSSISAEFIIRKPGNIPTVDYVPLSTLTAEMSNDLSDLVKPDADWPASGQKSTQYLVKDNEKYLELYEFDDNNNVANIDLAQVGPNTNLDVLVRNRTTHELQYKHLSVAISPISAATPDADDFGQTNQRSIQTINFGGNDYLQLYAFNNFNNVVQNPTLSDYSIVARNHQTRNVNYISLSSLPNTLSAQGNLSSNVPVQVAKMLKFDKANDANIEIDVQNDANGNTIVTIGAYYV